MIRLRDVLGVELPERVATWLRELEARPSIAAEVEIVRGLMKEIALDELVERLGEVAILDVRTPHEYDGTNGQHCDPRQGHIPGARNIDVSRLMQLSADDAACRAPARRRRGGGCVLSQRRALGVATQVLRSLGYDARNYVGSWHEWSRHDDLPVER